MDAQPSRSGAEKEGERAARSPAEGDINIIPNVEGDGPVFTADGDIIFRAREGTYGSAYRVHPDGTGLRKLFDYPVIATYGVSPDGKWLVTYARYAPPGGEITGATVVFPLEGGENLHVFRRGSLAWSGDQKEIFLSPPQTGKTFAIPLPQGRALPDLPASGFQSEADFMKLPGVAVIDSPEVAPGPTPGVYVFSKQTVQRNLYRIPLP